MEFRALSNPWVTLLPTSLALSLSFRSPFPLLNVSACGRSSVLRRHLLPSSCSFGTASLRPLGLGGSESPPSGLKGESARGQQPPAQGLPLPLSGTQPPASPQPSRSRSAPCLLLLGSPALVFHVSWKERRHPQRSVGLCQGRARWNSEI